MTLATAMVEGVLDSSYAALAIFAGAIVLLKLLKSAAIGLSSTRFQYLADRMAKLLPALISPVRSLLLVIWGYSLLLSFRLYRPLAEWLAGLAEYKIAMGEFSLSLGSLVIFIVAVWASVMLANGTRKLLSDTIFPSFSFSHGAGTSIASLIYYACILGGFLIALSLAGFDVSKLTIILGALGVGVGFGLQGSVGNFINGITMLIERPIRQGDIINFDGIVGVVQQIGMRATTLRSPQGAEITIPNAALLGGKITNWSPFGSPRQIEIEISVELCNDQSTARRLILETTSQIKGIAANPTPILLFHGYSPGTMDFAIRMWTLRGTDWELARSQYISTLDTVFAEAGLSLMISRPGIKLNMNAREVAEISRDL
jgi:potassium-dependent mechanosensitive channel